MTVFDHLQDKDVFQKFYTKFLARRLIHSASISDDAEAEMISRMKVACGSDYTASMQKMVQDIILSKDLSVSFQEYKGRTGQVHKTGMRFRLHLLHYKSSGC
jgi:cullin 1